MVTIVTCTIRDNMINNVFHNFEQQLVNDKELIIVLNKDDMDLQMWRERAKKYKNVEVYQLSEDITSGEAHNFGVFKAMYDIIAKFDDDDFYSPYYLKGQLEALQKLDTDIIGKRDCYYYLEGERKLIQTPFNLENEYVDRVMGSSLIFKKEIFANIQFPRLNNHIDSIFQKKCRNLNIHPFLLLTPPFYKLVLQKILHRAESQQTASSYPLLHDSLIWDNYLVKA
uniref:Glycosyltransferase 2-like domain-containing protein n=1 Tax=Batrachochytrium dendrobatidis (strain JAM81 / FGSC 10211) TaxID=684364 RepID=F4PFL6_BATDJ|eukprot:XP_006683400.1 hypothetical protein BATDEDRAFT_93162 [Batrachochytrium dendrobatidis JAM81]